jgi:hypothetical protein
MFRLLFRENHFNEFIRKQQFDLVDMLSFIGGLAGLFVGISMLSIVEVVYWMSIRLIPSFSCRDQSKVHPLHGEASEEVVWLRKFCSSIQSYLNESSIHGFLYISKAKWIDKLFWSIIFSLSMYACFLMIDQVDEKIPNSRVTSLEDNFNFDGKVRTSSHFEAAYKEIDFSGDFSSNFTHRRLLFESYSERAHEQTSRRKNLQIKNAVKTTHRVSEQQHS